MPFRIKRPKNKAVSDRPKICAVRRSPELIMTSTPYFDLVFMGINVERGLAATPAYGSSLQV